MKSTRLPDAEFAVMEIIWELPAPVTIGQVREKLSEEKSWKLQTLVTLFGRLTERGFLRVDEKKRGREHLFYPTLTREEYLRMEMESFLGRYRQRRLPSCLRRPVPSALLPFGSPGRLHRRAISLIPFFFSGSLIQIS